MPWLQRCRICSGFIRLTEFDPKAAFDLLRVVLEALRLGSAVVERQHLLGQEMKPKRTRGLAVQVRDFALKSYVKSVSKEAAVVGRNIQTRRLKWPKREPHLRQYLLRRR